MPRRIPFLRTALVAGAAGGVAEMLWVAAYSSDPLAVAGGVTATVLPGSPGALAPLLGVGIHLFLSMALGLVLAKLLLAHVLPRFGAAALMPAALGVLAAIWAVNFLVVLPLLAAPFVALMPLAATLASKLLFGAALAGVLRRAA